MKKTIIISIVFIFLGIITGKTIYYINNNINKNIYNEQVYYFIQEGVYANKEIMEENTKKLSNKLITNNKGKYYVYLGITKNIKNAKKIEKIYKRLGYDIYLKEVVIKNDEFSYNLDEFDKLLETTKNTNDILTIEEVVLSNYDEITKK